MKVVKSAANPLLNRKEIQLEITHACQAGPSKKTVTEELSTNYSIPAENIYVYDMYIAKGTHTTVAKANMYNSFEDLKNIERAFVLARLTGEKETKMPRRQKKAARKKKYQMFGTLKRNMKKAARRAEE